MTVWFFLLFCFIIDFAECFLALFWLSPIFPNNSRFSIFYSLGIVIFIKSKVVCLFLVFFVLWMLFLESHYSDTNLDEKLVFELSYVFTDKVGQCQCFPHSCDVLEHFCMKWEKSFNSQRSSRKREKVVFPRQVGEVC